MTTFLKSIIAVMICCSAAIAADVPPAGTAVLVNGEVITTTEYRGELARILRLRKKTESELDQSTLAQTKKEALETLISRELLYQDSQRNGIKIKDTDVESEISKLQDRFHSEEEFIASLKKLGLTRTSIVAQIKRGMAIQALTDARFGAKAAVTESGARNYYNNHQDAYMQPARFRLSHILIKPGTVVNSSGTTSAQARIEGLRQRIIQGEDFARVARESDDKTSSSMGGDLGYFSPGQLGKQLEEAAFSLDVGQISQVIEDRFGYHVLKVTERRPKEVLPFEEVKERIGKQLQRERTLSEMTPYLKRLREAARIEIYLSED